MGACQRGNYIVVVVLLVGWALLVMQRSDAAISRDGGAAASQLSVGFYSSTCPKAEEIVRRTLRSAFLLDPSAPASLLRLAFHDCQVQACDASILLDSEHRGGPGGRKGEREARGNVGIRRLDIIDGVKRALERECPNTVSCADIVAMAGRDAVTVAGGPAMAIPLGRKDATSASASSADAQLPPASSSVDTILHVFSSYGMSLPESVAIMGAHTLGVGHCVNVVDRISPARDPSLSTGLYMQLRTLCAAANPQLNRLAIVPNDLTNLRFDNRYFKDVVGGRGLFAADAHLVADARTKRVVAQFAADEQAFFQAFASAFVKMVSAKVVTGSAGEVRTHCRRVN